MMNVVISCLVNYDRTLAFKFAQTCTQYKTMFRGYVSIINQLKHAYAVGIINNFVKNYIKLKYVKQDFVGNYIRFPNNTKSIVLYNYNGCAHVVLNDYSITLSLKYSTCRHLLIDKLLKLLAVDRVNYLSISLYEKVYGHIRVEKNE